MPYPFNEKLFNEELQCVAYETHYDFSQKLGILIMSYDSCCDMSGCIRLFQRIDPNILQIQTYTGNIKDTIYNKQPKGEWESVLLKSNN